MPFLDTVPEEGMFKIVFGTFLPDVELINITTDSAVMTLAEATANGFDIQEHVFPNGSKAFRLQVPFSHPTAVKGVWFILLWNHHQILMYLGPNGQHCNGLFKCVATTESQC